MQQPLLHISVNLRYFLLLYILERFILLITSTRKKKKKKPTRSQMKLVISLFLQNFASILLIELLLQSYPEPIINNVNLLSLLFFFFFFRQKTRSLNVNVKTRPMNQSTNTFIDQHLTFLKILFVLSRFEEIDVLQIPILINILLHIMLLAFDLRIKSIDYPQYI